MSRGFVPTPENIADQMAACLFQTSAPSPQDTLLDPGCGDGALIDGVLRWCAKKGLRPPQILGIELDAGRAAGAARKYCDIPNVSICQGDFLAAIKPRFDYIIGNPPYVSIAHLSEEEKQIYRKQFETAKGRFDLYILFFEQALHALKPSGRLVFITPEKFLYVNSGKALRTLLAKYGVEELQFANEATFGSLLTYPLISTVKNSPLTRLTRVQRRNGTRTAVQFPTDGRSLLPIVNKHRGRKSVRTLGDVCSKISCGIATGADEIFIRNKTGLSKGLEAFAYPTISGRQLVPGSLRIKQQDYMLVPYDQAGLLLPVSKLGVLGRYLSKPEHLAQLTGRSCAQHKPWYAFHDAAPLPSILSPKILCKDVTEVPSFWLDRAGAIVPRHSIYYLIPRNPDHLEELGAYLNGPEAQSWLRANCTRAASDFLRLQSSVLRKLPIPDTLGLAKARRLRDKLPIVLAA